VAAATYTMSGIATLNGAALSNVTVWVNGASPSATTTDASGMWSMSGLINATYAVGASKNAYSFYPASQAVVVNFANVTNVNFAAGWAIAVQVTVNSAGLAGVTVSTTSRTAVTDTSGLASLTGLSNGTYTVTPSRSGYTFSPTSYSVTISGGNSNLKTFAATPTGGAAMAPTGESTSQGANEPNMEQGGESNLEAGQDESIAGPAVMAGDGDAELYSSQEEPGVDLAPFIQPEALISISATYYAWDHLGTIRLVTNFDRSVIERHDFEPFGVELRPVSNARDNTHWYTGHERDGNSADPGKTGLDYMHFRYYGSNFGRFLSPDPVSGTPESPQSWNLYTYVGNNPIDRVDPDGKSWIGKLVKLGLRGGMKVIHKIESAKDLRRVAKEGEDVLVRGKKNARELAKEVGEGKEPRHDKAHGSKEDGYRNHYHAAGDGGGHIFYDVLVGTAAGLTVSHYAEGTGPVLQTLAAAVDLVNPLSLPQDVVEITQEVTDPESWVPLEETTQTDPEVEKEKKQGNPSGKTGGKGPRSQETEYQNRIPTN
jgi:RHS repeat-associated protein